MFRDLQALANRYILMYSWQYEQKKVLKMFGVHRGQRENMFLLKKEE